MGHGKLAPFIQNLYGGAHLSGGGEECEDTVRHVHSQATSGCDDHFSENAFSMTLGGGVDWNAGEHIGVRLIQAEYFLTRFDSRNQERRANLNGRYVPLLT